MILRSRRAVGRRAQAAWAYGAARPLRRDEEGLTVLALALGLAILIVPLAIAVTAISTGASDAADAAYDAASPGS